MTKVLEWLAIENRRVYIYILFFLLIIFCFVYIYFHLPPKDFPLNSIVTINSGDSLQDITISLYNSHIIKSLFFFRTHVILQGGEKRVIAGDYLLDEAVGPADLAYRFVHGQFHLNRIKITIPEGWNVFEISNYLEKTLMNFDKKKFLDLALRDEGYLFPDTYFVSPTIRPEMIVDTMQDNFSRKIILLQKQISDFNHSKKDILTMASILEREARTAESRKIVAGILWKRLSLDMPLQVDSTFSYINGKGSLELTLSDLQIDSPYNTYRYKGLPPTPIGNPGIESIVDAITPTKTNYLYFLSDKDGVMHYAKTFEEHIKNKQKYLK